MHIPFPDHIYSSTRKIKWNHSFKTLVMTLEIIESQIMLRGRISKIKSMLSV